MELHNLTPAAGSIKKKKRVGRGQGSGKGGTATRGHNGAQSRSGYKRQVGKEGGQTPLQRRLPKYGANKPVNRVEYKAINLDTLQKLVESAQVGAITPEVLRAHSLIPKNSLVKILGRGKLGAKVEVAAHHFSQAAEKAIVEQGGKINKLPR